MTHITVKMAGPDDVPAIADIIEKVSDGPQEGHTAGAEEETFIRAHIGGNGFTFLAECDGSGVGFLVVHIPSEQEENLGRAAGLPDKELPYTAHMEAVAVLPEYRGHGIQRMLMMEAEKELRRRGFRYAAGMISPSDPYSMGNCVKMGYMTVAAGKTEDGLTGNIVFRRL